VGNTVINQLQQSMQQLASHYSTSTGNINSLADLGITFNGTDGTATFDSSKVAGLSSTDLSSALSFLGTAKTGLGAFSQTFTQFSDPITGIIQTAISGDTTQDQDLQTQIASTTAKINAFQATTASQIEAADTLESEYESQQSELTASIQGLSLVLYGKSQTTA
jgi:flagellar capping protein FliD